MPFRGMPPRPSIFAGLATVLDKGLGAFVVHTHESRAERSLECFHEGWKRPVHSWGVTLEDENAVVEIGNQSGHSISFSVDHAAGILVFLLKEVKVSAHLDGAGNLAHPPFLVGAGFVERHHSNGNACVGGVVPPSQDGAFVRAHANPISRLRIALNMLDAAAEYPRVFATNALVSLGLQCDRGQG